MKTNEVMKQYNVTRKALLIYENKGLIHPLRDQSGYRDYREADLKIITKIILLRRLNISLDDIDKILLGNHKWIDEIEEKYQLEMKRLEVKKSYLRYVNDVINDNYDVNEAIYLLDESIKYEENHETKPFEIKIIFTMIIILFAILTALYSKYFYLVMAMIIVIIGSLLISFLDSKTNKKITIIDKLASYFLLANGGCGIYCYFQAKELLIFKLLLIFSFSIMIYAFSKFKCLNTVFHYKNKKSLNTVVCVVLLILLLLISFLKDIHIIEINNQQTYFLCLLIIMIILTNNLIKRGFFK